MVRRPAGCNLACPGHLLFVGCLCDILCLLLEVCDLLCQNRDLLCKLGVLALVVGAFDTRLATGVAEAVPGKVGKTAGIAVPNLPVVIGATLAFGHRLHL